MKRARLGKHAAVKPARPRKPRQGARRSRFITKAEARRRAARRVLKRLFKGATVQDGAKAVLNVYGVRRKDTWVVSKIPRSLGFRASEVLVICKRTGRVLYDGPANDEG
jgi:hypothetical protein